MCSLCMHMMLFVRFALYFLISFSISYINWSYLLPREGLICSHSAEIACSVSTRVVHSAISVFNRNANIKFKAQLKFNFECRPSMVITFRKGFNLFLAPD